MFGFASPSRVATPRPKTPRRPSRLASWALTALAIAGCGVLSSGPSATAAAGSPAPTFEAPAPASPALTAYRDYWATVETAALTANWRDPKLAEVATGPALQAVRQRLYGWARAHRIARGHVDLRPVLVSSSPRVIRLTDCIDSTGWQLLTRDGPVPAARPAHRDYADVTLTARDGQWKVAGLNFAQDRSC